MPGPRFSECATVLAEGCVTTANWLATAAVITNAGLVVAVRAPAVIVADIVNTLLAPTRLIERLFPVKSATPATAVVVTVPERVPLPVVNVTVTTRVASVPVVTTFPKAS